MDRRSWIGMVAVLLAVAACRRGGQTGEMPPDTRPVRLYVVNNYAQPVDVYAIGSGTSYRIGTVHPGMKRTFLLRQSMIGQGTVEFMAQPANRVRPVYSGGVLLSPGNEVDFEITPQLVNSVATVRP